MSFTFTPLDIPEVVRVDVREFRDDRGFFIESYRRSAFLAGGIVTEFVQDNRSFSSRGVLRGLHYQRDPWSQGKLVSVVSGEIFDVAVDLRSGSPSFGRWVGEMLSAQNRRMLWIPEGFAHGFVVVSDSAHVSYKVTNEYEPAAEGAIRWDDDQLAIGWPTRNPHLSLKDANAPLLQDADISFRYSEH